MDDASESAEAMDLQNECGAKPLLLPPSGVLDPCRLFTPPALAPPPFYRPNQPGNGRPAASPPSSFPTGLQAVGPSDDARLRRASRTDLDFEQALRASGTVMLKESPDLSLLGADALASPSPAGKSWRAVTSPQLSAQRAPRIGVTPSTPILAGLSPTPGSSNATDVFGAEAAGELQTKRRSMYRAAGTASSPDLATLVRKAKEKGGKHPERRVNKQDQPLPELPSSPPAGSSNAARTSDRPGRARSSTSSAVNTTPGGVKSSGRLDPARAVTSPDWILTSPRVPDNNNAGHSTASVRQKTTAFLSKMFGQNTVRERSRSNDPLSTPTSSSAAMFQPSPPPVPPFPDKHRRPTTVPVEDVFSSPPRATESLHPAVSLNDNSSMSSADTDDQSIVVVEPPARERTPSPERTVRRKASAVAPMGNKAKRRSMSVGEAELRLAMSYAAGTTPLPSMGPTTTRGGARPTTASTLDDFMVDFRGQLSGLDGDSSAALALLDPSTPARRPAALVRSQSDSAHSDITPTAADSPGPSVGAKPATGSGTGSLYAHDGAGGSAPTVTLHPPGPDGTSSQVLRGGVPPRSMSLQANMMKKERPSSVLFGPRPLVPRASSQPTRPLHVLAAPRSATHLRAQGNGTASNSEPSLLTPQDRNSDASMYRKAQQELTASSEHSLSRWASSQSLIRTEEAEDLETKGMARALQCYTEDEEFLPRDKIAEWLGGHGAVNAVGLRQYMDLFDFSDMRLVDAFRHLCNKLYLKAETQQVDRILVQFSRRYQECNPSNLLGSASVVHAVTYSMLLLNTDLHVAELTSRMSKPQFVRNTLNAIQMQLHPERFVDASTPDLTSDDSSSLRAPLSGDFTRSPKRSGSIASWNSASRDALNSAPGAVTPESEAPQAGSGTISPALVSASIDKSPQRSPSTTTYDRAWEIEMESYLKDTYSAIKTQQILQPLGSLAMGRSSTSSLVGGSPNNPLKTRPSMRGDRVATLKRGSIRGFSSLLGAQSAYSPYGSGGTLDGRVSPSPSFATSHEGGFLSTPMFVTPTLGFASNLSHTIIREAQEDDDRSQGTNDSDTTDLELTDEELALLGAPWAKEGILARKHYWESTGKKARNRNWQDVFVVISKGELSMFTFGDMAGGGSGVVGGGNWLENAVPLGTVSLAHSLAHALPPPGYNRQRPHCMVLTLANGGTYFFQAGTEELVHEWTSTCNYWAARTSKEPLAGGVSNMEYGWSRVEDPVARSRSLSEDASTKDGDEVSVRSGRSNKSKHGGKAQTVRSSPWNERILINDWKPPMTPAVPSAHDEETQLDALKKHVKSMNRELSQHNEMKAPMVALYRPSSAHANKADNNWQRKSQYLLTELIKYKTYVDSLQSAMALRLKKQGEKALERALERTDKVDTNASGNKRGLWRGKPDQETIVEGEEPPPTPVVPQHNSHRRETAESAVP